MMKCEENEELGTKIRRNDEKQALGKGIEERSNIDKKNKESRNKHRKEGRNTDDEMWGKGGIRRSKSRKEELQKIKSKGWRKGGKA